METKFDIALLDDEPSFNAIMKAGLSDEFNIKCFTTFENALDSFKRSLPDMLLLDIYLGARNGLDVCRELHGIYPNLAVSFITADNKLETLSEGFEAGGVDYFQKTMSLDEISHRIRGRVSSMVRRKQSPLLICRNITLNVQNFSVKVDGEDLELSLKEFEILKFFMQNQGQVIPKEKIQNAIWGGIKVHPNNIDTQMSKLRKKFDGKSLSIECIKGRGYILHP